MKPFEELYEAFYPRIYAFLFRLSRNRNETEDLTQETFYQAFTGFHRFIGQSDPYTWLVAIAKHVFYHFLRKKKRSLETVDLSLVVETYCANAPTPLEQAEKKEIEAALRSLIRKLPDKYKDVIMLRIYAQLSFAQVASILKISENSAKVLYYRAKKMLMEELQHGSLL
jgi:RNA polymerase sigma-70 factor (ECF subfamily)